MEWISLIVVLCTTGPDLKKDPVCEKKYKACVEWMAVTPIAKENGLTKFDLAVYLNTNKEARKLCK